MNDIISRQAAIDEIVNTPSKVGYYDNSETARYGATFRQHEILDIIERLPSAQPELQWIPCSERLPEHDYYGETFQATIQCEHVDGWDDYVSGYADWTPNGWDIQSCYQGQIKVVAWMPMPEPWKGEME